MELIKKLDEKYLKKDIPSFKVGDVVDVHVKIKEGEKERIQVFNGTVIKMKGGKGLRGTFTVRRIVQGEGVERVFPVHSPAVEGVIVKRPGRVRRAKLYYLRDRVGKATKVKERREDDRVEPGPGPALKKKKVAAVVEEPVA
jgi:large subunit ribosomal protein L19